MLHSTATSSHPSLASIFNVTSDYVIRMNARMRAQLVSWFTASSRKRNLHHQSRKRGAETSRDWKETTVLAISHVYKHTINSSSLQSKSTKYNFKKKSNHQLTFLSLSLSNRKQSSSIRLWHSLLQRFPLHKTYLIVHLSEDRLTHLPKHSLTRPLDNQHPNPNTPKTRCIFFQSSRWRAPDGPCRCPCSCL